SPTPVGLFVPSEGEALVVLGGGHNVFGSRADEDVGPMVRVEEFGAKHRGEIEVRKVGAVDPLVELPGGSAVAGGTGSFLAFSQGIPIPLGVFGFVFDVNGREGGNGVNTPVDEDAEFGVGVPGRHGAAVDRFPGGLVRRACGGRGEGSGGTGSEEVASGHRAEGNRNKMAALAPRAECVR